jgi:hypothetical protein
MRYIVLIAAFGLVGCADRGVEDAVRQVMKDPDSAQFRDIERCKESDKVWLGEVNAKNAFGAYAGYTIFFYDGDEVYLPDHPRFEGAATRCLGIEGAALARDLVEAESGF